MKILQIDFSHFLSHSLWWGWMWPSPMSGSKTLLSEQPQHLIVTAGCQCGLHTGEKDVMWCWSPRWPYTIEPLCHVDVETGSQTNFVCTMCGCSLMSCYLEESVKNILYPPLMYLYRSTYIISVILLMEYKNKKVHLLALLIQSMIDLFAWLPSMNCCCNGSACSGVYGRHRQVIHLVKVSQGRFLVK